jgi:hypothetical protein
MPDVKTPQFLPFANSSIGVVEFKNCGRNRQRNSNKFKQKQNKTRINDDLDQ